MIRILFVDDEAAALSSLRLALRKHREAWDMVFALGGGAGITELSRGAFDVVVSDLRMPEIDGTAVLEAARRTNPRAARIILSGHSEPHVIDRVLEVAHRFLSKPCGPDALREAIERSMAWPPRPQRGSP